MKTQIDGTIMSLFYDHTVINREGFYIEGWYTESEGGEQVDSGRVYNKNNTIYAHWKPIIKELRLYNIEPMRAENPFFILSEHRNIPQCSFMKMKTGL